MKPKKINVSRELRRLIRKAVSEQGGTGGSRQCQYCLRSSFRGQPQHWRVGVKSDSPFCDEEADDPCEVDIMKAALVELRKRR